MEFSREKLKQIRRLMVLAAVLVLVIIYSDRLLLGIAFVYGITKPFIYGAAVAFVLNIPMRAFEERLLKRWNGKLAGKLKRPVCMVLSLVAVAMVIAIVLGTVVPQVTSTAAEVGRKIPGFVKKAIAWLDEITENYPVFAEQVQKLERLDINWESMVDNVINFLKNGAADMLTSTVSVASGIISGIFNAFISFIFALYILSQKEKLENQGRRIVSAFLPKKAAGKLLKIFALLYKNFSSFITGQCVEAVILGIMFVISMSVFRMPYALMVGVLIAFTALIPIVGAFIGCGVGAFLIFIDNPLQAMWFVILFLILQQIEGNLIYPKVVGNSVGLPSIWVLMAVSLGGSLFGVVGMLIFIPLTSTGYALLRESVNSRNMTKGCTGIITRPSEETVFSADPSGPKPGQGKDVDNSGAKRDRSHKISQK